MLPLLAAGVVGVAGCAPKVRVALPSGAGTPLADVAAAEQAARESCKAPKALTADLRMSGRIDGGRVRGTLQVGLTPTTMRLEGVAPFGGPVFVLAAKPEEAVLLLPRESAVVRGPSAAALLDAVVGVSLSPADLLAIVSGCGVADWKVSGGAAFGDAWTRLDLGDARHVWVHRPSAGAPAAIVAAEDARWRVEYTRGTAGWPTAIRLVQRAEGPVRTDAAFAVDAPEALDALPDGALEVEVPAGTRSVGVADLKKRRDLSER
ncbi:MAG TPA: hypothetical protein VMF13_04955 [Luteitalea sp.]|nr:hypothetical protein [Luteitalea sp.]